MAIYRKIFVTLVPFVVLIAFAFPLFWRSPDYYNEYTTINLAASILTGAEYDALVETHARPYILEIETQNSGALLLYGSEHTQDPNNPQIAEIEARWMEYQPTVALIESRLGFFVQGFQDPVQVHGEMGWVFSLARKDSIRTYTWEVPREHEIRFVLEEYPKEQVALFYILRPYFSNLRFGKPDDPDAVVAGYIRERGNDPGIDSVISSVEMIDAIWQRDFPSEVDWRDTTDEFGLPGYLGAIAARSNEVRDEHFARVIVDLVQKGERVFAISGSSHVVKLEPALRATIQHVR